METTTTKTWESLSPREKSIYRSAGQLCLREYLSTGPSLQLLDDGLIKTLLPEPITKGELEVMLMPVNPGEEFHFCDYVRDMEALLVEGDNPFKPLRQRLERRLDVLAKELDDYDLTLVNFHTLLGVYLLNLAKTAGLVTPGEKTGYFIRKDTSP